MNKNISCFTALLNITAHKCKEKKHTSHLFQYSIYRSDRSYIGIEYLVIRM